MTKNELTADVTDIQIDRLQDLLVEAEKIMIRHIPDGSIRVNFRRQCLTHIFALSINTADGAIELIKSDNLFSAGILTRALFEQWVNMQYLYTTSTYESLVRYLYDGDASFIKNVGELGRIYSEINHEGDFDELLDDTGGGVAYRKKSSQTLKKYGYPLKKMPSFLDRVRMIDKQNNSIDLITEYYYSYTHLSSHVHTTKDKIIEMTYANTYTEWMQATGQGELPYRIATMLNIVANLIEEMLFFYATKHRARLPESTRMLVKKKAYLTYMREYKLPSV